MSNGPLHFAMRELHALVVSPSFWAVIGGASLLLGLIGPFGTYEAVALPGRLAYWAAVATSTYLAALGMISAMSQAMPLPSLPRLAAYGVYGALAGVPVAVLVWGLNAIVFSSAHAIGFLPLLASVIVITAVVSMLLALFHTRREADLAAARGQAADAPAARPVILDRLPAQTRGQLSHMTMQDHYVDVRTDRGGALVLMRFADAVSETQGVAGLQIHRSHWVAIDQIAESVRMGGRPMLRMQDGTLLPVSRTYLDAVRAAGLF